MEKRISRLHRSGLTFVFQMAEGPPSYSNISVMEFQDNSPIARFWSAKHPHGIHRIGSNLHSARNMQSNFDPIATLQVWLGLKPAISFYVAVLITLAVI